MNRLKVPYLHNIHYEETVDTVSLQLDELQKHSLDVTPWTAYPYKPQVQFAMAHSDDCILLKYYVVEKNIRAAAAKINGAVWEDACVEFFISFDGEGYYNLEFNCIGTALVGFGKGRAGRELLAEAVIEKIKYASCIANGDNAVHWDLTLVIPFEVFTYHHITSLKGKKCSANFYKCGDALPEPHFVAWSTIEAPQPDFHLPHYFGEITFE